jgi:RimJ/RimL family protein N-acetyltransferase
VVASPDVANVRSVQALEKAGFRRVREITTNDGQSAELQCVLDRQHFLG